MMVVTDLDGTLLNSDIKISKANKRTLRKLGEKRFIRIIATGRNYFSVTKCVPRDLPLDYLVFSSGAGIMDWKNREVLKSYNLTSEEVRQSFDILVEKGLDFAVLYAVPNNHKFEFIQRSKSNPDFERRNKLYGNYAKRTEIHKFKPYESCQLIAIDPGNKAVDNYNEIKDRLPNLKVIRSTSPLDNKTLWIEIYSSNVSKAKGVEYIAEKFNISKQNIMVIGNDYNDLDLLNWSHNSFVVDNTPNELKKEFDVVNSNDDDGFTDAVNKWLSGC